MGNDSTIPTDHIAIQKAVGPLSLHQAALKDYDQSTFTQVSYILPSIGCELTIGMCAVGSEQRPPYARICTVHVLDTRLTMLRVELVICSDNDLLVT